MSVLYLVRHGQASFLDGDYDRLSPLGKRQAVQLGARWGADGLRLDAVFHGPRRRHESTVEALVGAMRAAGSAPPEPVLMHDLDEYRALDLLEGDFSWVGERADIAPLLATFRDASSRAARARAFEKLFQAVMRLWVQGSLPASRIEPWLEFSERVERALAALTAQAGGRNVAAISSAGAIGRIVGCVLRAPADVSLELGWVIHNASVTELLFSGDRATLSRFNSTSHLDDATLLTYR